MYTTRRRGNTIEIVEEIGDKRVLFPISAGLLVSLVNFRNTFQSLCGEIKEKGATPAALFMDMEVWVTSGSTRFIVRHFTSGDIGFLVGEGDNEDFEPLNGSILLSNLTEILSDQREVEQCT